MTKVRLTLLRWKIEARYLLMRDLPLSRSVTYFQAALVIIADLILEGYPIANVPPGVAIAILGLAAIVVSIRPKELEQFRWEKAAWLIIAFFLFVVEVHAIYSDRDQHDRAQAEAIAQQRNQFAQVLEQNQEHFARTLSGFRALQLSETAIFENEGKLSKATRDQITGGDSFCYLDVFYPDTPGRFWEVFHKGNFALYEVQARIVDVNKFDALLAGDPKDNYSAAHSGSNTILAINDLSPGQARGGFGSVALDPTGHQKFDVYFTARNGFWTELIRLQRQDGKWYQAKRVLRIEQKQQKVIFEQIDKGYRDVDWAK